MYNIKQLPPVLGSSGHIHPLFLVKKVATTGADSDSATAETTIR